MVVTKTTPHQKRATCRGWKSVYQNFKPRLVAHECPIIGDGGGDMSGIVGALMSKGVPPTKAEDTPIDGINSLWGMNDILYDDIDQVKVPAQITHDHNSESLFAGTLSFDDYTAIAEDGFDGMVYALKYNSTSFTNCITVINETTRAIMGKISIVPGMGQTAFSTIPTHIYMDVNYFYIIAGNFVYKVDRLSNAVIGFASNPGGNWLRYRPDFANGVFWRIDGTSNSDSVLRKLDLTTMTWTTEAYFNATNGFGVGTVYDFDISDDGQSFYIVMNSGSTSLAGGVYRVMRNALSTVVNSWTTANHNQAGTNARFIKCLPNGSVLFNRFSGSGAQPFLIRFNANLTVLYQSTSMTGYLSPRTEIITWGNNMFAGTGGDGVSASGRYFNNVNTSANNSWTIFPASYSGIHQARPMLSKSGRIWWATGVATTSIQVYTANPSGVALVANLNKPSSIYYEPMRFHTRTDKLWLYSWQGVRVYDKATKRITPHLNIDLIGCGNNYFYGRRWGDSGYDDISGGWYQDILIDVYEVQSDPDTVPQLVNTVNFGFARDMYNNVVQYDSVQVAFNPRTNRAIIVGFFYDWSKGGYWYHYIVSDESLVSLGPKGGDTSYAYGWTPLYNTPTSLSCVYDGDYAWVGEPYYGYLYRMTVNPSWGPDIQQWYPPNYISYFGSWYQPTSIYPVVDWDMYGGNGVFYWYFEDSWNYPPSKHIYGIFLGTGGQSFYKENEQRGYVFDGYDKHVVFDKTDMVNVSGNTFDGTTRYEGYVGNYKFAGNDLVMQFNASLGMMQFYKVGRIGRKVIKLKDV